MTSKHRDQTALPFRGSSLLLSVVCCTPNRLACKLERGGEGDVAEGRGGGGPYACEDVRHEYLAVVNFMVCRWISRVF